MVDAVRRDAYEDILMKNLEVHFDDVRRWYSHYYEHSFGGIGSDRVNDKGLMYRFNMSEKHSAVRGLQAYCYISTAQIPLPPASGGVRNMIRSIIGDSWVKYADIYMCCKSYLQSTNSAGQFIIMLTEEFFQKLPRGRYVWVDEFEVQALSLGTVPKTFRDKMNKMLSGTNDKLKVLASREIGVDNPEIDEDKLDW